MLNILDNTTFLGILTVRFQSQWMCPWEISARFLGPLGLLGFPGVSLGCPWKVPAGFLGILLEALEDPWRVWKLWEGVQRVPDAFLGPSEVPGS